MGFSEDAVLAYWKEHREQLRQSETQRSTLTNFLLVIVAAVSALIVQQKFSMEMAPLAVLVVILGGYGALAVAKYYERASYHLAQARALTKILVSADVLASGSELEAKREEHNAAFPRLRRLRLHHLWVALHSTIAIYGVALLLACLF